MKAVILVGGKATRLMPLTANVPKAMVPVVNEPFIKHVIDHLTQHGIDEIVLAQGHLANSIERYVGDGSQFGAHIYYSTEPIPLGSAGAAKFAESYLDGTFLVMNADIISDLDFSSMLRLHNETNARITIATTPVEDPSRYGVVEAGPDGRVTRFVEKPKREEARSNMINAGAWFVDRSVLDMVQPGVSVSFERDIFPRILAEGQPFYSFPVNGYWIDMGTRETYLQLHADLLAGLMAHQQSRFRVPLVDGVALGPGSRVDASARIEGPVVVGANCSVGAQARVVGPTVVGEGAVIGARAVLEASVVWRGFHLGEGARVTGSAVANDCRLEAGCVVEQAVLGDGVIVRPGARVPPGSKIDPGTVVQ